MDYVVNGKNALCGEIPVYGAKNCALAMLAATVLTKDEITLENVPDIVDVENMLELLRAVGKKVTRNGESVTVCGEVTQKVPQEMSKLLRGSTLLLGSTLAKYGEVFLPDTGGCAIGKRPIDIHLEGLKKMGVDVSIRENGVQCTGFPKPCEFHLRFASVGATENLVCASTLCSGETVLVNCALEPEVVALERLLVKMGANIQGIGTSTLKIQGVEKLHGARFEVIPDRIVVATYLACAVSAGGKITITKCIPQHLQAFLDLLSPRFDLKTYSDAVTIDVKSLPSSYGNIVTAPYPAFPTDVQQLALSLCAQSDGGTSTVTEKLFENRLLHNAQQLNKMGASVSVVGDTATIVGRKLSGTTVVAQDLRGGAGLVIAALGASGQTRICQAEHVLRGYKTLEKDLRALGADIVLMP